MPVHLYGTACDMSAVMQLAHEKGLLVVEDAAQGIGVTYNGRHVGGIGDFGCFSFFADKTITTGEGGYVVCRDSKNYEKLLQLRNQGRLDRGSFIHPAIGYNFRITDVQAAIGLAQFARLDQIIKRKQEHIENYVRAFADLPNVRVLRAGQGANHVPFRCVIIVDRATELMKYLEQNGVQSRTFFFLLHSQPGLAGAIKAADVADLYQDRDFPNAIFGWERGVCLPMHASLSKDELDLVCSLVRSFYRS